MFTLCGQLCMQNSSSMFPSKRRPYFLWPWGEEWGILRAQCFRLQQSLQRALWDLSNPSFFPASLFTVNNSLRPNRTVFVSVRMLKKTKQNTTKNKKKYDVWWQPHCLGPEGFNPVSRPAWLIYFQFNYKKTRAREGWAFPLYIHNNLLISFVF